MVKKRGPFDAILIDGDHSLAGVSKDWQLYGELAPLVAFHDIAGAGQAEKVTGNWWTCRCSGIALKPATAPWNMWPRVHAWA